MQLGWTICPIFMILNLEMVLFKMIFILKLNDIESKDNYEMNQSLVKLLN